MKKNITHFMYVPFTGLGLHDGFRGNRWLKNRIRVFNQFTLPSLTSQTDKNFYLWISWRDEELYNPIVQQFYKRLQTVRDLKTIFTFEGICFYDDKYEESIAKRRLLNSLRETLPQLAPLVAEADNVLVTIQPSDDMYVDTAVAEIKRKFHNHKKVRAVGYRHGYIMDYATKEIADYNPDTSPPFYTIRFPKDIFIDPQKHYKYIGPYKSHEYVKDFLSFIYMKGRGFVVGTHGENISTIYEHPYRGHIYTEQEKCDILIRTGTLYSDPVIVKKGIRLLARQALNLLPFQDKIRSLYHSLPNKLKIL